jgi:malonyl CoA-acyl carrier protein transacylase
MTVFGNVYVLDRAGNKLSRNGKTLGRMNDINCVELKTTGASRVTNTVRIILNNGRRIFVETGRPDAVSALASSIAQFAGVQIVWA